MKPANIAAFHAFLKIIKREPECIERIPEISNYIRTGFKQVGFKIVEGITPIVPVITEDDMKTFLFWRRLIDERVFANTVI